MRARFFAQNLRRFVNSDVIIGTISNAITLNRYAYANGNPVSNVDPFGLMPAWGKVVIGVGLIVGLAIATACTGGMVAAVLGAAAIGATVSGTVSAATSAMAGDSIDEVATSFMVGTVSGAASGAIAASTLNAGGIKDRKYN